MAACRPLTRVAVVTSTGARQRRQARGTQVRKCCTLFGSELSYAQSGLSHRAREIRPAPIPRQKRVPHCPAGDRRVLKLLSEDPGNYADAPREGIRRVLEQVTMQEHPRDKPVDTSRILSIRMGTTVGPG